MTVRRKMIALIVLPTLTIYIVVLGLTMAHLQIASQDEVAAVPGQLDQGNL